METHYVPIQFPAVVPTHQDVGTAPQLYAQGLYASHNPIYNY